MAFTVEHVKSLLQHDLVTELEKNKDKFSCQVKQVPYLSQSKLYEHLTVLKTDFLWKKAGAFKIDSSLALVDKCRKL